MPDESVADASRALIGVPDTSFWSPVVAGVITSAIVQVKLTEAVAPESSVTVRVTSSGPPVVGVPEITPVAASSVRPDGNVPPSE